ncbi:MAG: nucleotidyltransferase family protein [Nanoarchaeota archaeon]|nr:nucleotidyltransferase family protein [Nanoarchaeota archaeon]
MKLVLMAGGKGERLYPLTKEVPKPMLPLNGKPVLEHTIEWAKQQGLKDIIICSGYLAHVIEEYFGNGEKFGVNIKYSIEKEKLGTAGPLKLAKELIGNDNFIMLHADILCQINAKPLMDFHNNNNALCTLVVHKSSHPEDSDLIEKDEKGKIVKFWKKPHSEKPNTELGNSGMHVFSSKIFNFIPDGKYSMENELLPNIIETQNNVFAYHTEEFLKDMGTFDRIKQVEEKLKSNKE